MSSENQNMELVDKGWEQMQTILDREMPEDDSGFLPLWWIVIGVLLLILGSSIFWIADQKSTPTAQESGDIAAQQLKNDQQSRNVRTVITEVEQVSSKQDSEEAPSRKTAFMQKKNDSRSQKPTTAYHQPTIGVKSKKGPQTFATDEKAHHSLETIYKISPIAPLQVLSLNFFDLNTTIESEANGIVWNETDIASHSNCPFFLRFMGSTNYSNNIGLQLDGGLTYHLGGKWHASTSLGYQYNFFGQNSVYNVNISAQDEVVNAPNPNEQNEYSGNSGSQLTYDNFEQHLLILSQSIDYALFPDWSIYGETQLGYALNSSSQSQLVASYPVIFNDNTIELRQTNIPAGQVMNYTANWYYGFRIGIKYNLSRDIELQSALSTMQAFQANDDQLKLNESRRLLMDLGVVWKI